MSYYFFVETKPPRELVTQWVERKMHTLNSVESSARQIECENEMEYLEDVNPEVVHQYNDAKATIEITETDVRKCTGDIEAFRHEIEEIRQRWVLKLENLVHDISDKFSTFFAHMGYAGQIVLDKGQHDDDFSNYGIEIMVKFRDKYDLQRLDPFKQSGGERSVSTALYMMAMQTMTKVPFRCLDEINQG